MILYSLSTNISYARDIKLIVSWRQKALLVIRFQSSYIKAAVGFKQPKVHYFSVSMEYRIWKCITFIIRQA